MKWVTGGSEDRTVSLFRDKKYADKTLLGSLDPKVRAIKIIRNVGKSTGLNIPESLKI